MPGPIKTLAALAACAALMLPACGGDQGSDGPKPPSALSTADQAVLQEVRVAVGAYCRKLGLAALRRASPPTPAELQRVEAKLQGLVALGREKPAALTPGQRTIREAIGDIIEDVEGSNCPGPLAQTIERARAAVPAP